MTPYWHTDQRKNGTCPHGRSGLVTVLFHVGPGRGPRPQCRSQPALHRLLRAVIIVFPGNTVMWPSVDARAQQQPQLQDERTNQPAKLRWLISYRKDYVHDRRCCVWPVPSGPDKETLRRPTITFLVRDLDIGKWRTWFVCRTQELMHIISLS